MPLLEVHFITHNHSGNNSRGKIASNQGWNEERLHICKRIGGMHQLKEVDMLSAKMDLLMKRLEDRANQK
jgi:hypothetical protein